MKQGVFTSTTTSYRFTGHTCPIWHWPNRGRCQGREEAALGLYYYGARWYRAASPQRSGGYGPWGDTRYTYGSTPTSYRFTGQREEAALGLYYYGARWYDVTLGHFIQADTIVPDPHNPQDWDRYAYTRNNPVRYTDPSGHVIAEGGGAASMGDHWWQERNIRIIQRAAESRSSGQVNPLDPNLPVIRSGGSYQEGGNGGNAIEPLLWFVDKVCDANDIFESYEIYEGLGKGGWKVVKWALLLGPVEAAQAAIAQIVHDEKIPDLTFFQRTGRGGISAVEAYAIDQVSTFVAVGAAAGFGLVTLNPVQAGGAFLAASYIETAAMEELRDRHFNPWLYNNVLNGNLGYYPYHE